ncbi:MAG: Uma2 family endonuclease [Phormidesmis sp.]
MGQPIAAECEWALQVQLLRQQLQRSLTDVRVICPFAEEEQSIAPLFQLNSTQLDSAQLDSAVRPAIAVYANEAWSSTSDPAPLIHWVIDVFSTADATEADQTARAQYYAECGIAEYWSLAIDAVELRTYRLPTAASYQQRRLFHTGDFITPQAFPHITLQIQEPLPLYFLTRTATGPKSYVSSVFPLRLLS